MSEVANTSKTVLEIYQPIIVGLGAVVLGMLATAAVEWWRVHLSDKVSVLTLRRAIYSELLSLERAASDALEKNRKSDRQTINAIFLTSDWLAVLSPSDIGKLSRQEVESLSKVRRLHEQFMHMQNIGKPRETILEHFPVLTIGASGSTYTEMCSSFVDAICEAKLHVQNRIK